VLVNLLGNAIKFTERGGVRMTVSQMPIGPGHACLLFAIEDSGIGMRADQIARLFHPFEQGDASTTRRFGGTGLGLTISKNIADLMQGSIDVASLPGKGSCFTLRVCFDTVAAPPEPAADAVLGGHVRRLEGVRILAAEDDPVNQWVIKDLLEQEGASCQLVDSGVAALEVLGAGAQFDVFLTDVQMPGLDGYETVRRSSALWPQLPVIGLTAHALPEERQRCLDAGMRDHVTKPIDIEHLFSAILRVLPLPSVAPVALPDALPAGLCAPIDWDALWTRMRRPAAVQKAIESLLTHHAATAAALRELLAANDSEGVRMLAHKLRGVAGLLSANLVLRAATGLEDDFRATRNIDAARGAGLADAMDELIRAARAGLADLDRTRPAPPDED
jgi:CheY-like chemotaxis protein